jgi:hypothetical protein
VDIVRRSSGMTSASPSSSRGWTSITLDGVVDRVFCLGLFVEPLVERLALLGGTMRTVFAVFAFFVGYLVGSFFNLFV